MIVFLQHILGKYSVKHKGKKIMKREKKVDMSKHFDQTLVRNRTKEKLFMKYHSVLSQS